ncbi:MAG: hypothetical protein EOP93_10930, partial [Lysobacteraceae bacterium]
MTNPRVAVGPGFRICFDDEPDYLRAYVFDGTDSLAVSVAMWGMLAAECRKQGADRLLVLEDLLSTVEGAEIDGVVDAMERAGLERVRIAFVELRDDIEGNELGEIMCRERGMTIRTFTQEPQARRW